MLVDPCPLFPLIAGNYGYGRWNITKQVAKLRAIDYSLYGPDSKIYTQKMFISV